MAEQTQTRPLFSGRELTALLWPLVVEQLLAVAVGMADVVMVSSAGEAAVSGVSLVDMINVLIINIFAALATGGAVVTSQLIGARKPQRACQSAWQLVWVSGLLGLAVAALALVFSKGLIRLFFGSITDDVFDACMIYLCISALSYPFLAVYNSCAALFRSMGNSRISMQVSMGMNLFNIAGNAVGVYLLHLGVAGVALPTLISRAGACVVMLVRLRAPHLPVTLAGQRRWQPDFALIRNILHIGIPSALENSMFQLGRVLVVSIISAFGTVQRRGQQPGQPGLHPGPGGESGRHHGGGPVHRGRGPQTGHRLRQKAGGHRLPGHDRPEHGDSAHLALDAENVQCLRRDIAAVHLAGVHP